MLLNILIDIIEKSDFELNIYPCVLELIRINQTLLYYYNGRNISFYNFIQREIDKILDQL